MDRSKNAKIQIEKGTHPFLPDNMTEESLEKKRQGIKSARLRESSKGIHPWQNPWNWIDNEYSRSISVVKKRGLSEIELYVSDCEFDGYFKIGWTYNTEMRYWDSRTHEVKNATKLRSGSPTEILGIERLVKKTYYDEENSKFTNSTEIFPNSKKEIILEFINSL